MPTFFFPIGGGSGGGGAAVQKTGDTMTGQLVVKGDQFSTTPGVMIQPSSGTGGVGICIGPFGDEGISFNKSTGTAANLRVSGNLYMTVPNGPFAVGGAQIFDVNDSGGFHLNAQCDTATGDLVLSSKAGFGVRLNDVSTSRTTRLTIDANGDIVAKQTAGPNAGKSVNLTSGKWV